MKFVKETNGNVRVTDDTGENITLIQDIGVRVQAEGVLDTISISQNGFEILRFATADVSGTKILPNAEIPFAGTTSDLIQILTDDFFLISSSGGGGTIDADALLKAETSVVNSSITPLTSGSTFTGTAELNDISDVLVYVTTDQNGVLYCEFSSDGTNWDTSLSFQYDTARINPPHILVKGPRYFRVRFENNSGSNQTFLRLKTYYGYFNKLTAPINGTLAENYDATVVRPTDYKYEVAMGKRQGRTTWNKFGFNADVDTGGQEIVGSFGGTFNIMTTADTLDVVSSSANDTSAGTGAQSVLISGIDANFSTITEIVTLNGTTPVTTTNSFLGVNRAVVLASGSGGVNAGTITIDDTSGTVGTQAELPIGSSVTQQAIFHTQISHIFLADWLFINIRRISGGGTPRCTVRGFSYSRVTDTTYEIFTYRIDTGRENTVELRPSQPFVIGGREVFYFTCETNVNNTTVSIRFSGIEERVL
jgi:hypothetical protein